MMSKRKAHLILILFDMLAILVCWIGYNEISQVVGDIAHSADSVEFNNRVGFFFIGVVVPIAHLLALYEYLWPKVLEKKKALINSSAFILFIIISVCCFSISIGVKVYVERAAYLHCPRADSSMTFCTYLVYTRDDATCSRRVEEKRKPRI
jgi:hypothetical protein